MKDIDNIITDIAVGRSSHIALNSKLVCHTNPVRYSVTVLGSKYNVLHRHFEPSMLINPSGITMTNNRTFTSQVVNFYVKMMGSTFHLRFTMITTYSNF